MECLISPTVRSALSNSSPSAPVPRHRAPRVRRINGAPRTLPKSPLTKRQPSVAEVEKAIGAGLHHDNTPRVKGEDSSFLNMMLSSPFAQPEGSVERKLREVGEWVIDHTERSPRSGQHILMTLCLYILPVWALFLMVASGLINLPFNVQFVDDLIM